MTSFCAKSVILNSLPCPWRVSNLQSVFRGPNWHRTTKLMAEDSVQSTKMLFSAILEKSILSLGSVLGLRRILKGLHGQTYCFANFHRDIQKSKFYGRLIGSGMRNGWTSWNFRFWVYQTQTKKIISCISPHPLYNFRWNRAFFLQHLFLKQSNLIFSIVKFKSKQLFNRLQLDKSILFCHVWRDFAWNKI